MGLFDLIYDVVTAPVEIVLAAADKTVEKVEDIINDILE